MEIKVSIGEVFDKISILILKSLFIKDDFKLNNILNELNHLKEKCNQIKISFDTDNDYIDLYNVNKELWDVEDKIRIKDLKKEFDDEFIKLARSVYFLNDKRAEIKRKINLKLNSDIIEEKSYEKY